MTTVRVGIVDFTYQQEEGIPGVNFLVQSLEEKYLRRIRFFITEEESDLLDLKDFLQAAKVEVTGKTLQEAIEETPGKRLELNMVPETGSILFFEQEP